MIVAIPTNNGKTISNHMALAKKIAFYNFPEKKFIKIVSNPIVEMIKEKNIKLEKNVSSGRHLKVGQILPKFLSQNGANIFVSKVLGEGFKQNLIELGIKPIITEINDIEEALKEIKI